MKKMTRQPIQSISRRALFRISVLVLIVAGFSLPFDLASGQEDSGRTLAQTSTDDLSVQELQHNYDHAVDNLRNALKAIKRAGADYYQNKSSLAFEYREKWEAEAVIAEDAYKQVRDAAFALFFSVDQPDNELVQLISGLNQKLISQGQLTTCYDATRKLLDLKPGDAELTEMMGRISIMTNDFDSALRFYKVQKPATESFGVPEGMLYNSVESLNSKFQRELELREVDARGEELPHAIVKTNKGTIVIELFENQAPETVGNFVNLVEKGFYDNVIFHRVLKNIFADTGKMTQNRAQTVDYTIYDESKRTDARHHFRGSVTMILNFDKENSGAAEFRIMLVPGPHLDGKNTVFGRVISGLQILDSLQETFTINEEEGTEEFVPDITPDTIESITLKRLRKHEYEPHRFNE